MQEVLSGIIERKGYIEKLLQFVKAEQLTDRSLWKLFVDQYRDKADTDNGWRGEYWGKTMRGAVLTYLCSEDQSLYACLEETVRDLLSIQEEDGRISSYPRDRELDGWDMWGRKYVLLGCLYFYEICQDETLKLEIVSALCRHLDYIIERVGDGKKSIFQTSRHYGGLNSCSILEPVVRLYKLTGKEEYLKFATYIVQTGFCQDMNLIELCLHKEKAPYQFVYTKAYEMMSCFQGLLEYYEVTGNEDDLRAVLNFADVVNETDITLIGCAGCMGENFDNAFIKQTEYSDEIMQETCVTVTWMNLCFKLLKMTGEAKYADWLECSALNAMSGAVNTEKQKAARAYVWDGSQGVEYKGERGVLPFDSYSPLYKNRRGKGIGGFNVMKNGCSYGCCAAIGSAGVALSALFGVMKDDEGICVNLYENVAFDTEVYGVHVSFAMTEDLLNSDVVKVSLQTDAPTMIKFRIPKWSNMLNVSFENEQRAVMVKNGYAVIVTNSGKENIELQLDASLKKHFLNGKIAFTKGPYVLSFDQRISKKLKPLSSLVKTDFLEAIRVENTRFDNLITLQFTTKNETVTMCDYASAGKNFDEKDCDVSVWWDLNE